MKLEDVILVTNDVGYTPTKPIEVCYLVSSATTEGVLILLRDAVLKKWRDLTTRSTLYAPASGIFAGFLAYDGPPVEDLTIIGAREKLYNMGFNTIRQLPAMGYALWGTRIWLDGVLQEQEPAPIIPEGPVYTNVASVGLLRANGVDF